MTYVTRVMHFALSMIAAAGIAFGAIAPSHAQPSNAEVNAQGVNGWNVIRANYDGGLFQLIGDSDWIEVTDDANTYRFSETGRDDWSVYMHDASRDTRLQIDIHRQMITVAVGNEPLHDLYPITSAHHR